MLAAACAATFAVAGHACAASLWWDGSAGASWAATSSWSTVIGGGGDPVAVPGSGDDVTFNADGTIASPINTLGGVDQAARSLTFRATATPAIALGAGNTLDLYGGTITVQGGTAAHAVNPVISLGDPAVAAGSFGAIFSNAGTGNLKLGGNIAAANAGASWSLTVDGGQTTEFTAAASQTQPFAATAVQNGSTLQLTGAFATGNYSFGAAGSTITLTGNGRLRIGSSASSNPLTVQNAWAIGSGGARIETYRIGNPNERYVFSGATALGGDLAISVGAGTVTSQWQGSINLTGADRAISILATSQNGYLSSLSGSLTQDAPGRALTLATGSSAGVTAGRTVTISGANSIDHVVVVAPGAPAATTGNFSFSTLAAYPAASLKIASGAFAGIAFTAAADVTAALGRITADSTGVLGLDASMSSNIGLSAAGLNRDLRIGSSAAAVTYTGTLTPYSATYKVGGGGGTLTFGNANAFTGTRDLDVATQGTLSGGTIALSNTNDFTGSITVGAGMNLQGNNTYTGTTTVDGGTLELSGAAAAGRLSGTTALAVRGGATLQNGSGTASENTAARINDGAVPVTLGDATPGGGTYTFGLTSAAGGITQQHTALTVSPGFNAIKSLGTGTTPATLQFTGGRAMNVGGIVSYTPAANFALKLAELSAGHLGPAFVVGYTVANSGDWGQTDALGAVSALGATAQNVDPDSWAAGSDVNVTTVGTYTLDASLTINSLRMAAANSFTLNIGAGQTLTVTGGGVLVNGANGNTLGGGGTVASAGDLYLYGNPDANQGLSVDVALSANAGAGDVTLTGGGRDSGITGGQGAFFLKRANAFRDLYVTTRMVDSQAAGALGTGSIRLVGGGLSFDTVAQTVSNDVSVVALGTFLGAGTYAHKLTGNLATYGGTVTVGAAAGVQTAVGNGVLYLAPAAGKSVSGPANLSVTAAGLAVASTAALPAGNFRIGGGVLVLDGRAAGNDVIRYADLAAARTYGAGAGQWQFTSGGFAARGAPVALGLGDVGLDFNRDFTLGSVARAAASQAQDVGLIVHDGTLTLGTPGTEHAVRFVPAYKAANDVLPDFTNVGDASGGTRTVVKLGTGTLILGNVRYTRRDLATDASSLCAWSLGSGVATRANVGQALGAFGGAVRETGSDPATSLSGVKAALNGGVIEFADTPRSITLAGTPAAGQVSMNSANAGGGFAAIGGHRSLAINGGASLEWENSYAVTGFLRNYQPLIFGSLTADSTLTLANNINLHLLRQTIATVRGVGSVPEGEISGALSNGSLIVAGLRKPDGTPLAAGTLVLSGVNTYAGETHVTNGTLIVNGALTAAAGAVRVNTGAALGGTGTVSRAVTVADGGTIAAGSGGVGTLTTGALTLSDRSTNRVDLAAGAADVIAVNGDLTLDGTIAPVIGAAPKPGKNLIMTYTGALTDNGVTVARPSGLAAQIQLLVDADAKEVYLVVRSAAIVMVVR